MNGFRSTKLPSCHNQRFCHLPPTPDANSAPAEHDEQTSFEGFDVSPNPLFLKKPSKRQVQERNAIKRKALRKYRFFLTFEKNILTTRLSHRFASTQPGTRTNADLVELTAGCMVLLPNFSGLTIIQQLYFCNVLEIARFTKSEAICKQGEMGKEFFIVLKGAVNMMVNTSESQFPRFLGAMSSGQSFGEMSLLYSLPRMADVLCATPFADVLRVDDATFNVLFKDKLLKLREVIVEFLRKHLVCLNGVMESVLMGFASHMTEAKYKEGTVLDLDAHPTLGIIRTGQLRVMGDYKELKSDKLVPTEMASLGPGQIFAEGCCYEEMKQGWSGKVKKELTFLQIKSETFTENVDKVIFKRIQGELAFRNSYFAGRKGLLLDFKSKGRKRTALEGDNRNAMTGVVGMASFPTGVNLANTQES